MSEKSITKGDLVQWIVSYDDDPDIVKDGGIGIVVTKSILSGRFRVYRNKFNDIINVSERSLKRL